MRDRTTSAMLARIGAFAAAAAVLTAAAPAPAPADGPPTAGFPVRLTWSGPPSTHPNTAFTYTGTVINTGATGRTLFLHESAVASAETFVSASPSQGSCALAGTNGRTCTFGTVAAGASVTVTFTSKATYVGALPISLTVDDGVTATFETYPLNVVAAGDPLETDVRLSITGPDTIHQSDLGVYTITARNADSVSAHGVVLRGHVGNNDRLVRASVDGVQCPIVPTLYEAADCTIGDLAPGASVEMTVEAVAYLSTWSDVRASITQDWNGTTATRSFERRWTLPILPREGPASPQPGGPGGMLALRVDHPDTGTVGTHLVFTETITNLGPTPSGPLTLTLTSSHADIIEHDHAECTRGVQWISCTLPGLAAGASTTLTFRAYPFSLSGGPMLHGDTVASNGSQASSWWAYEAVNPALPAADISIVPLGASAGTNPSGTVNSSSTWRVTNNGPERAFGVMILDTVSPATTRLNPLSGCGPDWCTIDWLEPGTSTTVTLSTLGPDATVHHAVRVYHSGPDPVPGNNAASADAPAAIGGGGGSGSGGGGGGGSGGGSGGADLYLTGAVEPASAPVGSTLTWRLRVLDDKNYRPATGVRVQVTLPGGVQVTSTSADRGPGCASNGTTTLTCNLDWLSSDAPYGNIVIVTNVTQAGELALVATVAHDHADSDPTNNTLTLKANTPTPPPSQQPTPSSPRPSNGITRSGTPTANTLTGTPFADVLRGLGGNDRIDGRGGADRLYGGAGNDSIIGGAGTDLVDGGAGNDNVNARDGRRDTITCGPGRDTVTADRLDVIARGCESVTRR